MFVVDEILVSDAVAGAPFSCNLHKCLGGCCVQGDQGAPLEKEECEILEDILPKVRKYLRPEAVSVIEREGVWEETGPGEYATTCVKGKECVFVTYEGPIARCSIQKAYHEGKVGWEKPISCHLFPIRAGSPGGQEVLNYENIPLFAPACRKGRRNGIKLYDFLQEPLIRKYGRAWYHKFRAACVERDAALHR
jgi:hypothetical protein